jgi:hypothetical protein
VAWIPTLTRALIVIEPFWGVLALLAFLKAGMANRFPAMRNLLYLRIVAAIVLTLILNAPHFTSMEESARYSSYFYTYWFFYIAGAIATFFVLQEIFTHVLEPVPGLRRLGLIAFRWVSIISVIVSVLHGQMILPKIPLLASEVMRCISILELCLLAFLVLSIHSLGLSFHSRAFGICLGFGMQAVMEMIGSAFPGTQIYSTTNFFVALVGMITWLTWTGYFLLPKKEAEHVGVALPVTSPLLRWNEIAKALGHSTPHVAVGSTGGFFLQDVEKVVDRVMTKNALTSK